MDVDGLRDVYRMRNHMAIFAIMAIGTSNLTECVPNDQLLGSLDDAILFQSSSH